MSATNGAAPDPRPEQVARMNTAAIEAVLALARNKGDESAADFRRALSVVRGTVRNATLQEQAEALNGLDS